MAGPTLYFFNGATYIRWTVGAGSGRKDPGYPQNVVDVWGGDAAFMNNMDAALNGENGKVYFFKGDEYTRWTIARWEDGQDDDYPRKIVDGWNHPFLANGVDAAVNRGNGVVYFFRGDEYLRWNLGTGYEEGPIRIAERWHPWMAGGIDAALDWEGKSFYFFRGDEYLRWTIDALPGENVPADYPKKIAGKWDPYLNNGIKAALNWNPVPNFTFDDDIAPADVALLKYAHARVLARIGPCTWISEGDKMDLWEAYRRPIRNGTDHNPDNNGSQQGNAIFINFDKLRNDPDEMAQTVIHEMMHVADKHHPPFGAPGYYDSPPLRAEACIAGRQSDRARGAPEVTCVDEDGLCAIKSAS